MKKIIWLIMIAVLISVIINIFDLKPSNIKNIGTETNIIEPINITEEEIINNCLNKSLQETAECLTDNINLFYNYNEKNIALQLSFERLRDEGGVCWHYSALYSKLAKKLGFNAKEFTFVYNKNSPSHRFVIISKGGSESGYCLLDQLYFFCLGLE